MTHRILCFLLMVSFFSCKNEAGLIIKVSNQEELNQAIEMTSPGQEIIMSDGIWNDINIRFYGKGTKNKPITLRAETPGNVFIEGRSDLKIGGEYLVVEGLHFRNGQSPGRTVISYSINNDTLANHCRVTNCVIKDFNKSQRNKSDLWVQFKGRHNQLDHCYLSGKSNRGPTIRVDLAGNQSINNYHKIVNNHFGPRPPKGGPSAETIQLGNSYTSMAPSYTLVADNLFDRCNGEVEVISSKTNFNEFRNNIFYKSEGSLVTRHGNYCTIDGNYFIGDEESNQIGGVRLIGTGHWVTNNYFYKLKGEIFRSPLAVMNGIPKSPLNRYIQVTDVVVAYNSWIDCSSPLQFGVGANLDEKDVLPPSEIRSARPIRTLVANNVIYNSIGDLAPVVAHDSIDGITFKSNAIQNQGIDFHPIDGIITTDFTVHNADEDILIPSNGVSDVEVYNGFEFDQITKDLFGNSRLTNNSIGATTAVPSKQLAVLDRSKYGPVWYDTNSENGEQNKLSISPSNDLSATIKEASEGDVVELAAGIYTIPSTLVINKKLTIRALDPNGEVTLFYKGESGTPLFEMNPKGDLALEGIQLKGDKTLFAFATLKKNMSSLYNLSLSNCEVSNFDYILKGYKYSFSEHLQFQSTIFKNCNNGIELSEETDDRGEYNAENITIDDCRFEGVGKNVIDYYRGGYDESTIGGNLLVKNSSFTDCGALEKNGILLNTYGIINVNIHSNTFENNKVKVVAQLWGAKNNKHYGNKFINSGEIIVTENLKLNLLY